jgi:hypothetical protein
MNEETVLINKDKLPPEVQDTINTLIEDIYHSLQRYFGLMVVVKADRDLIVDLAMTILSVILVVSSRCMGVSDDVIKQYIMRAIDSKNEQMAGSNDDTRQA